jgi:hypothetical protein
MNKLLIPIVVLMAVICGTGAASATNYDLTNDYVANGQQNANGAWNYGNLLGTYDGNGNFNGISSSYSFVPMIYQGTEGGSADVWADTNSGGNTCEIFYGTFGGWNFPATPVVENSWVTHVADVRWAGAPGTYSVKVTWQAGGYTTPSSSFPTTEVGVLVNGGTPGQYFLTADNLLGFNPSSSTLDTGAQQYTYSATIAVTAGETLDFFLGDYNSGSGESRASVEATLTEETVPPGGTNYDLNASYVNGANPNGAWSYGYLYGDYDGNGNITQIDPTIAWTADTYAGTQNGDDSWYDTTSGGNTCQIFHGGLWTFPGGSTVENSWVNNAADVEWAGAPGTYYLSVTWQQGGYTTPTQGSYPSSEAFVLLNGGTANQSTIAQGNLLGFNTSSSLMDSGVQEFTYSGPVIITAGETLDFALANYNGAVGECRASVEATLTAVSLPAVLESASRSVPNATQVNVQFTLPLYPPSVTNVANYSIPGETVTAAQLSPSASNIVVLTIKPGLFSSKTLTVNGVENNYDQTPVAPNSQALITVPIYVPLGIGTPTNAAQDTFSGTGLSPYWQSGIANDAGTQAETNYVFANDFVWSNGVLHCHADNQAEAPVNYWDPNYLIYVNPDYAGQVQNVLIHLTIINSNHSSTGVAGVGVCVSTDPYLSTPEGGDCLRAVPAGYGSSTNFSYPYFLTCSDYVSDEPTPNSTNTDAYNLSWQVGGSYWLRIQQTIDTNPATSGNPGGIVSAKAWAGDGSQPEPANWQYTYKDPLSSGDSTRSGYAGIRAGFGVGVVMDFDVDYFLVTAPGLPTITPTLPPQLVPQPQIPPLSIATGGGDAVLSWPAGGAYQLQSSSSLSPVNWSNVNTAIVVNGSQNTVTVPLTAGQDQFFRLIQTQ